MAKISSFLWFDTQAIVLGELLADSDRKKADRVMQAMLKMKKIDVAELQRAHEG